MLTDYHVHLRPDESGTSAAKFFTKANAERYREAATERGIAELGVAEHMYRFTQALDVWQHPFWRGWASEDLDHYCAFVREETDLRLGIEADFVAGVEDRLAGFLDDCDWDYVVGSVHFIRDGAVDIDDPDVESIWGRGESAERVWDRYFRTLADAVRSGLFDIVAHPDLVKLWGSARPVPDRDPRFYFESVIEAMLEADVAVEVSTAGWRKPVGEIYPAPALLEMVVDAGLPIALSSDAHTPDIVGHRYGDAIDLLASVGVTELSVFDRRQRSQEPIG